MSSFKRAITARLTRNGDQTANAPAKSKAPSKSTVPRTHPPESTPTPRAAPPELPAVTTTLAATHIAAPQASKPSQPTARRHSSSNAQGSLFRLGELPLATKTTLARLLDKSSRAVTVTKADAARFSVVTALENRRDLAVLAPVVSTYVPYALTCWDVAVRLRAKGTSVEQGITWLSALMHVPSSNVSFSGAFGLEACVVLVLHALCMLRAVVETPAELAMNTDAELVAQIKSLQVAAGVLAYVRDTLAPPAMANFVGTPPPELYPDVAAVLFTLCMCVAQALHVRRGALGGMSAATLAKLSAGAVDLAQDSIAKYEACVQAHIPLTEDVKSMGEDMLLLTRGWMFQYLGLSTPAERAGEKVSALREGIRCLQEAGSSGLVGKVAVLDVESLERALSDAVGENKIVYQHEIPNPDEITLPPGRSLVKVVAYDAPRIQRAGVPQQSKS